MYHRQRWTPEKIKARLELIAPLVHIRHNNLPSFRYKELADPTVPPAVEINFDDSEWQEIVAALEKTNWKVAGPNGAAVLLGIPRSTLQSRMQKLGIERRRA
jgi:transcriptional regulator with GAF, ATPase, and Fis domain